MSNDAYRMGPQAAPLVYAPLEFRLRSGGAPSKDSALVTCPIPSCQAPAFIRRSERITAQVKHLTAHCTNSGCGATFELEMAFLHLFSPGAMHTPDMDLPICPRDKVPMVLPPTKGGNDDQMSMFEAG